MKTFTTYSTHELKLVYRVLHAQLMEHLELLDSEFFSELQTYLQSTARDEGVDVSDHGAWDAWLGNKATPCEARVLARSAFN